MKNNLERRSLGRWRENKLTTVILLDDSLGEREPDAPPALLCRKAGFEDAVSQLSRHARSVIRDTNDDGVVGTRLRRQLHHAAATGERVDGVFCQHLDGPLEQYRIA